MIKLAFIFEGGAEEIQRKLREAAINKFMSPFKDPSNLNHIELIVQRFVKTAIMSSETWKSLQGNEQESLNKHFGIPKEDLTTNLETILNIWASQIQVEPVLLTRRNKSFVFTYRFYAIRADWAEVLGSEAGVTINASGNHPEGQRLHWLSWLLKEGDQITVEGYHISFEDNARSRSGGALMRPKYSWRIPQRFAPFNTDNNFVTEQLKLVAENSVFRQQLTDIILEIAGSESSRIASEVEGFDII